MDRYSDYILIQDEIGESSWFGFSMIVKPEAEFDRKTLLQQFDKYESNIDQSNWKLTNACNEIS